MYKFFFILVIQLFLFQHSFTQPVLKLPFNKKISINDGLSSYNIKKIIQDRYGFIWIATQDGLNRYDGKSFLVYNKSLAAGYRLSGNDVWDMQEDRDRDILWVVTSYGGVDGIDLRTAKVCSSLRAGISIGSGSSWLKCIRVVDDRIWIGSYNGLTVYNLKTKNYEQFEPVPFAKSRHANFNIDNIFIDHNKNVWLFIANYGIAIYAAHTLKVIGYYPLTKLSLTYRPAVKQFNSVTVVSREKLLIGTNQGFRRIDYTATGIGSVSKGLYDNDAYFSQTSIEASSIDPSGDTWFSASSKLFKVKLSDKTVQEVKDCNTDIGMDWLNYVDAIFFDEQNNVWLGTRKGVAYTKNAIPAFTPYFVSDDLSAKIDHAYSIYPFDDSIIYAGTETGLLEINTADNKISTIDKGKLYYLITEHTDKNLLVSNDEGIFVYKRNKKLGPVSDYYPELTPLQNITINSITYTDASSAVIGTETMNGFYVWDFKNRSLRKIDSAGPGQLATNIVNTSYKDGKGRIWVLGDDLITIYDPLHFNASNVKFTHPSKQDSYKIFFDICEAKSYYWIAAYGTGLLQIDHKFNVNRIYSIKDGLSNAGVYKLFPVRDSLLFITTNNGLSVFNLNTQVFNNYYQKDGLHSGAFEEGCGIYKNGKVYAGGVNGFTIIDPTYFSIDSVSPKLYLNNIKIETTTGLIDTSNLFLSSLEIPKNVLQTTIFFSALNFSNPTKTVCSYRIKELNSDWISLGTQNFVNLMGMSPGKYTLQVRSANEDKVWNNKPLEIRLTYVPKWYQTFWFKLLVLSIVLGLLYLLYRYRIGQIRKRERMRQYIARDLHDDVGSNLTAVKSLAVLARHDDHNEGHLIQVENLIDETIILIRDMIWVLDNSEDTVPELIERIRRSALPIAAANKIRLTSVVEEELDNHTLSKREKRNLLMIAKEAINNIFKYAECNNIQIGMQRVRSKLALEISDDGKGFDPSGKPEGHGFKNIASRANEIGYTAEIISAVGKGTVVRVVKK